MSRLTQKFKKFFTPSPPSNKDSSIGYVIDWEFHRQNRWVCALTPFLTNAIVETFKPVIITSQKKYNRCKKQLDFIISESYGWSAPKIDYDTALNHKIAIIASDLHHKPEILSRYILDNQIDYVLSKYKSPYFYHMREYLPDKKFVHFPWAIPDGWLTDEPVTARGNDVIVFGGKGGDSYNVRNWCREQEGITSFENSGVENKMMSDEEFFRWLKGFDAVVAAGSDNPIYDMVTPKYFETAAAGSLLFAQHCADLDELGFNDENCVIFTKGDFVQKVKEYRENPAAYLPVREKGRAMIRERHKVSDRMALLRGIMEDG